MSRDYDKILAERYEVRERCKTDITFRMKTFQRCYDDTLYWMDMFAWTLDPRRTPAELPFILYEGKQIEYLNFLEELLIRPRDVFLDKPRDVGATAIAMNFFLKHWLFDDYFNVRVGSRKEDYVDKKGDPDTLYYKIDYTMSRLPQWMLPAGWNKNVHRTHLKLERPDNSNTVTGESANDSFARGGRQKMVFFDEIGFWNWARAAWQSAGDVTDARIAVTTPPDAGQSSFAYRLLTGQAGDVEVMSIEYSDIPHKDEKWYKDQKKRRSPEEFEREVLKSYTGTLEGKVYAGDWQAHVNAEIVEYNSGLPLFVSWDFGLDSVAMIWWQKDWKTEKLNIIDCYSNTNKTIDFYIPFITGDIISGVHRYNTADVVKVNAHKGWRKDVSHYGDPDVHKRSVVTKTSAHNVLQEAGIYVQTKPWKGRSHRTMREQARLIMRRLSVDSVRCQDLIDAMISAQYPRVTEGSQRTTASDKPIHDWTSHYRTAFEYFADNEPVREKLKVPEKPVQYRYKPQGGY